MTRQEIENAIDMKEMAYKITIACCRELASQEMHEKILEAIQRDVKRKEWQER